MRIFTLGLFVCLAFTTAGLAAEDQQEQLRQHEERISNLEQRLATLELRLNGTAQNSAPPENSSTEPLIGRWDCSNGVFRSEIFFEPNGKFLQKDSVLGETRTNRWARMGSNKIAFANGISFQLEFYSDDQFSVEDTNTRSTWDCDRLEN